MRIPNTAKQAGISEKEYVDKLRAGLEWCGTCIQWIIARNMSPSNPSQCVECYRKVNTARWRRNNALRECRKTKGLV